MKFTEEETIVLLDALDEVRDRLKEKEYKIAELRVQGKPVLEGDTGYRIKMIDKLRARIRNADRRNPRKNS